MIVDYNPFSTDYREDPYPRYARLRSETPVARSESSGTPMWIVEGEVLTPAEAVGFAALLVFAGTETTTNLIGNAVRVLRDPERWGPTAEEFDLDRETNGHLGFGFGVHFCLGAALARLEADCALRSLIPLLARSDFDGHEFMHIDSVQFRGVSRLRFTCR